MPNFAGPTDTWVRLPVQNFTSIATGNGNAAPKYQTFPLLVKSRPAGATPLTDFEKKIRVFYMPIYPTVAFQISCDWHHRLRSYCWETARQSIRPNFSVHPVGKNYVLDRKMSDTFYDGHDELYHRAKFREDRTTRAGCKCENVVFVTMFSILSLQKFDRLLNFHHGNWNIHLPIKFA